jgi:hypothetical protein
VLRVARLYATLLWYCHGVMLSRKRAASGEGSLRSLDILPMIFCPLQDRL